MRADVSGFREEDLAGLTERIHAELLINELVLTLVMDSVEGLEITESSREYVTLTASPKTTVDTIKTSLPELFARYSDRLMELEMSNICSCKACKNVSLLSLRVIVTTAKDSPEGFAEHFPDALQALWFTESARDTLEVPEDYPVEMKTLDLAPDSPTVWAHYPGGYRELAQPKAEYKSLGSKTRHEWLKIKGTFRGLFHRKK